MNVGNSIRHGVAWLFAGNSGFQVLNFLFGIVLARLLTPHDFGLLLTVSIFTGIAGFVAGGGLGQALVRAANVGRADYDAVFTVQLMVGALIYAVFFFVAPLISSWYGEPLFTSLVRVSALSFVLRPFVNLPSNWLYRNMRFKALAITNVIDLSVGSSISVVLAFQGYGVWSLIYGGLFGAALSAVLRAYVARWRPRLSSEIHRIRSLANYGALATAGDFVVYMRSQMANFVLSRTLGPAYVGLFNKASSLAYVPHKQFTSSVYEVTLRVLAKEESNVSLSQYVYLRSITLVGIYAWPIFLALGWLALPIIRLTYGEKWVPAAPVLAILAFVGPIGTCEIMAGAVLAARGWLGRELPVQIIQTAVLFLGTLVAVPYGLAAVAVAVCIAHLYGGVHLSLLAIASLSLRVSRIVAALRAPALLNGSVALLWFVCDRVLSSDSDIIYLVVMLACGASLYVALFLFTPLPELTPERDRCIDALKKWKNALRFSFIF